MVLLVISSKLSEIGEMRPSRNTTPKDYDTDPSSLQHSLIMMELFILLLKA